MSAAAFAQSLAERIDLPDALARPAIAHLVGRTRRALERIPASAASPFARAMQGAIAINVDRANAQHYELPADFFRLILGPRLKYSCCLYDPPSLVLAEAEDRALEETAAHAELRDGQHILELGCGWGSLTLWMAERYPRAHITAVSNSSVQRRFIADAAGRRGLSNVRVLTADMNDFAPAARFDRIVSVEMFEHMSNWRTLLERARTWLRPDGRIFLHVFSHLSAAYRFDRTDPSDWIARHFFTGGIMPSHDLVREFRDVVEVEAEWRWSGAHYARTAGHWLSNFDRHRPEIDGILRDVYGEEAAVWRRRWRLFFLAVAGLFGHAGGEVWGVSHYRLKPAPR